MPSDLLSILLWGLAAVWWVAIPLVIREIVALRTLPALELGSSKGVGTPAPRVSIVVTVRDEEARVGGAVRGLAGQVGVDAEILVADDRSSDHTPEILDCLARENRRVRVIRIDALPSGWLGKPHACHVAARHASGEWLLFTDGDAWMRSDVLVRAVRAAERERADLLCLLPGQSHSTLPGRAGLITLFLAFVAIAARTNRDRYRGPVGVGAFNLVRAEAYRAIGGHEPLRLEVIDDAKLGLLLLRAGRRCRVFTAHGELEVDWAGSLRGIIRALEKNLFASVGFSLPLALLATGAMLGLWAASALAPLAGSAAGAAAGAGLAATTVPATMLARRVGWGLLPALLAPVFIPVSAVALAHSTLKTLRQGGVRWRETFYPLDLLRRGRVR